MARADMQVSLTADPGTVLEFGVSTLASTQNPGRGYMFFALGDMSVHIHADRAWFADLATKIQQELQDTEISQQEREIDNAGK